MSAPVIITIIILIILVSMAIVFIGQARERARIEKIRKTNSLQDRYRKLKRLVEELPPQYVAKELRILIYERCVESLTELQQLQGSDFKHDTSLETDKEQLTLNKTTDKKPDPIPVVDEVQAKEVQALLEVLNNFVDAQRKKGFLDSGSAKKHGQLISYYISKSKADYYTNKAKENIKNGKLRLAIHNYHNAISELEKVKSLTVAQKSIKAFKLKIKELDKIAEQEKQQKPKNESNMDSEWQSFIGEEDDAWKKKNAYDD